MNQLEDAVLLSLETFENSVLTTGLLTATVAANGTYTAKLNNVDNLYDFTNIDVKVSVLDSVSDSPTNGYWISANAVVAVGWKDDGSILISNQYTTSLLLRIVATAKLKTIGKVTG